MINKKNRLFTFFFSLIPGAGEMYLGFYKSGASIMLLFGLGLALFGSLFPPFLYLLPVLWFYSFFHTHNLNGMSDEEFYGMEDDYLFHMTPEELKIMLLKYHRPLACLMILTGLSIIWRYLGHGFRYLSKLLGVSSLIFSLTRYWIEAIPQFAAALLIIWAGWKLFQWKRDSLEIPGKQED